MSAKLETLKTTVTAQVADLVTEQARVLKLDREAGEARLATMIQNLMSEIDALKTRIVELEASQAAGTADDKYALTKAKLVRLMKDMGYFE
jgi:hypothetical protein